MSELPLPLTFPLHGTRLIEASAGTGKTFTLAALYLRLVLGHGGDARGFARPLLPPEILVVTFTEAATEELRQRIRDRLAQAARAFVDGQATGDPILDGLLADYPDDDERQAAGQRLDAAAQWMDEAAIHTIHGFCNRMLKQHAFDSGSLFNLELNEDAGEEQFQAACDYWRTVIRRFPAAAAPGLRAAGLDGPQALLAAARPLIGHVQADEALPEPVALWLDTVGPQQALEQQARRALDQELPALRAWVAEALEQGWLHGATYKADKVPAMLDQLAAYAEGFPATGKDSLKALRNFSSGGLRLNKKGLDQRPDLTCLDALQRVLESREDNAAPRTALLQHAAAWIERRVAMMRRQTATMGFDDMLTRLRDALADPANGPRLARVIREQFPVALIDEFQDTDPVQYGIFAALYADQPDTGWFMIGDPKQAIYAFRGADVHTYLQARQATHSQHTLGRNFRSAKAMVEAVNRLFEHGEEQTGDVFLMDGAIRFEAVSAQGRKDRLEIDGQPRAGAVLWVEDGAAPVSSGTYRQHQAACCAGEIARLLNGAAAGNTGFRDDQGLRPLRSEHIAVLVRNRTEAAAIRDALARRNVRSVYLSDRDSVYATAEATDLLRLLDACATPEADAKVRSALACATLAFPFNELDALNRDERRWEAMVDRFHGYRRQWQRQGVLPMLRTLLLDFSVPERLSRSLSGERSLTNLLHLAELLQQAAGHLDGEQALLRHLGETVEDGGPGDEAVLRLESDDDRVRVITLHKSKGLEYPLVFLPFPCAFQPVDGNRPPLLYHRDGQRRIDLEPDREAVALADRERLAEDMRLLYVGLTRAQYQCWLGVAPVKRGNGKRNQLPDSALGRLLFGADGVADDGLSAALAPLAGDAIRVEPPPADNDVIHRPAERARPWRGAAHFAGRAGETWWIASYSALKQVDEDALAPADPRGDQLAEADPAPATADDDIEPQGIHAFPRGALPGLLLHDLLEQAGRDGFAATLARPEELDRRVGEALAARHWQDHDAMLRDWWREVLSTPFGLGDTAVPLERLEVAVPELEFLFPARRVSVEALDALIRTHIAPGRPRPRLAADTLNGMLKGFIDLVFEHQGRYYVLDYKSNWLGPDDAAYNRETMTEAVLESRYEVQYALYLLALHRLLRARLGDGYRPDQHLGGAVYVFLRGLAGPDAGAVFERPPTELIEALDQLFVPGDHHAG